ncbi:MAG: class I SAM-dependent methyltransferase [Wenzhouxiangella sp.]
MDARIKQEIEQREWFYRFELPDGSTTQSYLPASAEQVHDTRLRMMQQALEPLRGQAASLSVLDLASHQGWFSLHAAAMGFSPVTGLEPRASHVADARLMAEAMGAKQVQFVQSDIQHIADTDIEPADVVLMLGLLYHLENPVAAIRTARAYCKKICLIETQVGPHLSGMLDWGSYEFVRPIQGCFTVIDETEETHGNEASTEGICLAPSAETLLWIMRKVGFGDVSLIAPPADGYEQHRHGKRVLAVGRIV